MDFLQQFEDDLSKAFTDVIEESGWTNIMDAKLGDGTGVVIVPPAEAKFPGALWVYKTVAAGRKERIQVANTYAGIPYNHDWAELDVKVGYPPGERHQLEIMKVSRRGLYMTQGALPSQVQAAITEHLSPERWEPLRITAGAGLALNLIGGWLQAGSTLIYLPTTAGVIDLTGHRPGTTNMARYCMVYYDPAAATFGAVDGDDFDNTDQAEAPSMLPTTVPIGALVLGHVRLYNGQTGWGGTDILRGTLPFLNPPGLVPLEHGGTGFDVSGIQGLVFYNEGVAYPIHCVGNQVAAPTVNDDATATPHPFGVLSLWVMAVIAGAAEDAVYMCVDPSDGAAVWLRLDGSGGGGGGGGGTVTSVGLVLPAIFSVAGSPVTTSGTLTATLVNQSANGVFASPNGSSGTPGFRTLVAADIPNLAASKITSGQLALARGGTGADLSATGGANQIVRQNSNGGALTVSALVQADIPTNAIDNTRLADMAALTVKVRASNSSGDPSDLAFTADGQFLVRRSSALTVDTLVAADIPSLDASKITGGTFDNARINWAAPSAIGVTTPAAGTFTTLAANTALIVANTVYATGANLSNRGFFLQTGGTNRWFMGAGADNESGSNAGSGFYLTGYDDAGGYVGQALAITRANLKVAVGGELQIAGALNHDGSTVGFYGTTPASKPTIYGSRGANEAVYYIAQALATLGLVNNSTTA